MTPNGRTYDYIVIGSGAGGGTFAGIAAVAGAKVLLLERGSKAISDCNDHLVNQRLSVYGHNAGPDHRHPRFIDGRLENPWSPAYHANAAMYGGGTQVYGAQAWRFHPNDFQMATHYGTPSDSSLADWPIAYVDLEPWYEVAEHHIGVAGDAQTMTHLPSYRKDYPMPPINAGKPGSRLSRGITHLNWTSCRVPLAINSIPFDGRGACTQCQECVGFPCRVNAKNGVHNTWLLRGEQSGNLDTLADTVVTTVYHSAGRATGLRFINSSHGDVTINAHNIVVASGAIETARLLLASGFENNHIGRHLQGHVYTGITGLFKDQIWDGLGPGPTHCVTEFLHDNDGVIGGGMLADEFVMTPITYWKRYRDAPVPLYGSESKSWLMDTYTRVLDIKGPIQDIPSPNCRVSISSTKSDSFGMPLTELAGYTHPQSIIASRYMYERARELMIACGAEKIWGTPQQGQVRSGGQHQAGTCRMAEHPTLGVVDEYQKVFGFENVHICDGSVHVTNGTFNPVLTIYALAHRLASKLTGWLPA